MQIMTLPLGGHLLTSATKIGSELVPYRTERTGPSLEKKTHNLVLNNYQ